MARACAIIAVLLVACTGDRGRTSGDEPPPADGGATPSAGEGGASRPEGDASPDAGDGGGSGPELAPALASLRRGGLGAAAEVIEGRVSQPEKKMKLSAAEGTAAAEALARHMGDMPSSRKLLDVMPRSTVELMRAVQERGVPQSEAERIADFHLRFTRHVAFGNIRQLDENHSHVIGRDWPEIDYSGEGTTWQRRMMEWRRHGVTDFRSARNICRYFRAESTMTYYTRIYRPSRPFPAELSPLCELETE